jgi:hypothetical protein
VIAVGTNILVHAHRQESPWNAAATACLLALAEEEMPWASLLSADRDFSRFPGLVVRNPLVSG